MAAVPSLLFGEKSSTSALGIDVEFKKTPDEEKILLVFKRQDVLDLLQIRFVQIKPFKF